MNAAAFLHPETIISRYETVALFGIYVYNVMLDAVFKILFQTMNK